MNKILLRGGLCRTTRWSGSPLLHTAVRYQSSEEVAQDRHEDIDDVEVGHIANTLTSDDAPPRQANGSIGYHGNKGMARPPQKLDAWSKLATQPQKAVDRDRRFSRSGPSVASARPSAGVSAPASPWGALNGAAFSPVSRVNGKVAPAGSGGEGHRQIVHGAGEFGTRSVTRSVASPSRLPSRGQNTCNSSSSNSSSLRINVNSKGPARNAWDTLGLSLEPNDHTAGGRDGTQPKWPSRVEGMKNGFGAAAAAASAAASRSDTLAQRQYPASFLDRASELKTQNASASQRTSRVENGKSGPSAKVLERLGKPRLSPRAAAQEKLAKTGSLPWNLPAARSQGGSDMQGHREAVHKMLAGGRYGGSHAAHRGSQGPTKKKRDVNVVAKEVQIPAVAIPVRELAVAMSKKANEVVLMLRQMGESNASATSMVEPDIAQMVAMEFGLRTKLLKLRDSDLGRTAVTEATFDSLKPRPPVVSVMGHVDHGKTTLLDALRTAKAKVAGTEAAGITQKIGAFSVEVQNSSVTFFDTPGHAAFKSMRHATSRLTDIVVVVIAADDGVKSQTVEVFELLKEFPNLAPVVAVTKIDQYDVDTEKAVDTISRQLLEHNIITEGYGGEVPIVPVSAVTREGFDDLLETLLLQAEVLELRADDTATAQGLVVDSAIVQGQGAVADVLVTWGKLKPKDVVVAGVEYGKVRGLVDSGGKRVKQAGAAEPVRIVGMKGSPKMGDEVLVVDSESTARAIVAQRKKQLEVRELEKQEEKFTDKRLSEQATKKVKDSAAAAISSRERALYQSREAVRVYKSKRDEKSKDAVKAAEESAARAMAYAEDAIRRAEAQDEEEDDGPIKCFAIFRAEGFGMLEAMSQVMTEVPQDQVELNLLKTGLGSVTQSDVEAAALAEGSIFAFNVGGVPADVKAMAQKEGVQIHSHEVIYRFLDDVKAVMSSLLPPVFKETVVGEAKTLQVFETTGKNKESVAVAGLAVSSGKLSRAHFFRVLRDEEVVADRLKAASMRHHKDRVNEVTKDKECGVALEDFNEFKEGDVVQCFTLEEIKATV